MEPKTTTESSDRRFALLIDADNVSARYLKPILNELSKYGTVTIKRIYGDWTLTLHAKWKDALLENSITPIQQFGYTQGKNATDSAMIIDAMDILYTDNVDGFCLVSSDSDFTRLASRLRESGRMVIGMGEKKTPTPFRRACDVFTTLELLVQNKRNEKGGGSNAVPKDSVEQAVVDIITDNQNNGKATGLGEIGSRLQKRYPDFDVRSYGTNLLSKLLEEFTRVRITKDHSSVTVELAEGEERPEKAEKPERAGKPEKATKATKAEEAVDVASELEGEVVATEASSTEAEKSEAETEKPEKPNRRSRSHRGTRKVATKAVGRLSEGRQPTAALPEGEAGQQNAAAEVAVEVPVSENVEVVVETAPEMQPASQEAPKDVRPGRRARAERKTRQTKRANVAEPAKASEPEEPQASKTSGVLGMPAETEKPTRRRRAAKPKTEEKPSAKEAAAEQETPKKTAAKKGEAKKAPAKKEAPQKAPARKKKPAGDTPAGYIRELVTGAGDEGIMLSTITDAVRAKFKDFKVRDLGYSQMRQYMASVGDYELEKSGRNFRVRLSR